MASDSQLLQFATHGGEASYFNAAFETSDLAVIMIVDRRALIRSFLGDWIAGCRPGCEVISLAETEGALCDDLMVRVALVIFGLQPREIAMPWLKRQIGLLRAYCDTLPMAAIVDFDGDPSVIEYIRQVGLHSYIPTTSSPRVAAAALLLIAAGGVYTPGFLNELTTSQELIVDGVSPVVTAESAVKLTPREKAVLDLLETGMANKLIAYQLALSQSTVKAHVHSIISKLNVRNRTEAALRARAGLSPEIVSPHGQQRRV